MYDLGGHNVSYFKESLLYKTVVFPDTLTVKDFYEKNNSFAKNKKCAIQEVAAFYLLDQGFFILQQKYGLSGMFNKKDSDLAKKMHNELALISNRMFCFILSCCNKELSRLNIAQQHSSFPDYIGNGYSYEFAKSLMAARVGNMQEYKSMSLEKYIAANVAVFSSGKWWFGGGGSGWANIARAPLSFIRGASNLHEMTDLSFSLCHDRGSFFDRAQFGSVSELKETMMLSLNTENLYTLLDVQASGQIPQFLLRYPKYLSQENLYFLNEFKAMAPEVFNCPLNNDLIKSKKEQRDANNKVQWAQSQVHHNNIAAYYGSGELKNNLPIEQKIDKILINDYKKKGLIKNV